MEPSTHERMRHDFTRKVPIMSATILGEVRKNNRFTLFCLISTAVASGQNIRILKLAFGLKTSAVARLISIDKQQVRNSLRLHEMFVRSFGSDPLLAAEKEVMIDPEILEKFLSDPAARRIASVISEVAEAEISELLNC